MGSSASYENLLVAQYESVYAFVLTLVKNEQDALDITQETFLKAMKSYKSFKGNSSLYTWLCAIAKNIWLDRCKKQRLETKPDDWEENVPDPETPIELRVAQKDQAMTIHRALHELNEPYKEVFSLRVFGELSFSQIAALFGKTESWARVTYHRARKKLIERLGKDGLL